MTQYKYWPPNESKVLENIHQLFQNNNWWASGGEFVRELEHSFAKMHDAHFGVAVCNGTIAFDLILHTLNIGPGDKVLLPAYNFYSHPQSVKNVGATPVFVDVCPNNLTIDIEQIEALDLSDVAAIVAVHISGSVAQLDRLSALCRDKGIYLIEDGAQAHGASYSGKGVGSWGIAGLFSFGGTKLMSCGQGGIILTSDPIFYEKCYSLTHRGRNAQKRLNSYGIVGGNYQLSELAAALLIPQLDTLREFCKKREQTINYLDQAISNLDGCMPLTQFDEVTCRSQYMYSFMYDSRLNGYSRNDLLEITDELGLPYIRGFKCVLDDKKLFKNYAVGQNYPVAQNAQTSVIGILHPYLLHEYDYWQKAISTLQAILETNQGSQLQGMLNHGLSEL